MQQPDGTSITLRLYGDEAHHGFVSLDGHPMVRDAATGFWRMATAEERLSITDAQQAGRLRARHLQQQWTQHRAMPVTGAPRSLVVLVEYTDVRFTIPSPQLTFQRMLTEEGFSDYGLQGSARDYFKDQSNGLFTPQFDIYGPYQAAKEMSYYGENDDDGSDKHAAELVNEVLKKGNKDINFKDYDSDGDGVPTATLVADPAMEGEYMVDVDNDGVGDYRVVWEDIDGDGVLEGGVDRDGDGQIDDVDGDSGVISAGTHSDRLDQGPSDDVDANTDFKDVILIDTDGDGIAETQLERIPDEPTSAAIQFTATVQKWQNEYEASVEINNNGSK